MSLYERILSCVLSLLILSQPILARSQPNARLVVESFYKTYLNRSHGIKTKRVALTFSKSFRELIDSNTKLCQEKAASDVCGWGSDGDIYLDAQDYKLEGYRKSGLSVMETEPAMIRVKLNVYPSDKKSKAYYDREITFKMIQEDSRWVVDDIIYKNGTGRKQIQDEIDMLNNKVN